MVVPIIEERAVIRRPETSSPDPQIVRVSPDVIHMTPRRAASDKTSPGTIAVFVAISASCFVARTRESLKRGDLTVAEALGHTSLPNPDIKDESGTLVHLSYRGQPLVSLRLASCHQTCGTQLSFWGDRLEPRYLEAECRCGSDDRSIAVLVVIQPPFRSEMEQEVNRQVPVALSELGIFLPFGPRPVLLVMEQGWALGSYLAKIAALRIQGGWQNSESASSNRIVKSMRLSPPTENVDLRAPGKVLLHRYLEWLRSRRSK
jgi:hypothetical protein